MAPAYSAPVYSQMTLGLENEKCKKFQATFMENYFTIFCQPFPWFVEKTMIHGSIGYCEEASNSIKIERVNSMIGKIYKFKNPNCEVPVKG